MEDNKEKKGKSKKFLYIVIIIIVIAVLAVGGFILVPKIKKKNLLDKVLTAENYNEVTKEITDIYGQSDEAYYFTYSCMYNIMKDGLTEEYFQSQDDSILYKNVYNRTVKDLIEDGKKLMEENEVTMDKFKEQVETINNMDNEVSE